MCIQYIRLFGITNMNNDVVMFLFQRLLTRLCVTCCMFNCLIIGYWIKFSQATMHYRFLETNCQRLNKNPNKWPSYLIIFNQNIFQWKLHNSLWWHMRGFAGQSKTLTRPPFTLHRYWVQHPPSQQPTNQHPKRRNKIFPPTIYFTRMYRRSAPTSSWLQLRYSPCEQRVAVLCSYRRLS